MIDINSVDDVNRDWLTREEAEAFIGGNSSYYLEKWGSRHNSTLKGWNWAAAIFGIEWMAYRKMYLEAFLLYAFFMVAVLVIGSMFWVLRISFEIEILNLPLAIFSGLFGNLMYRKKALRVLRKTLHFPCDAIGSAAGGVTRDVVEPIILPVVILSA